MFRKVVRTVTYLIDDWLSRADPVGYARRQGVVMYGDVRIYGSSRTMFGSEPFMVTLGDNVHVSNDVQFITHDGGVVPLRKFHPDLDIAAPITVGDNTLIGARATVLAGVRIGSDCIVGACSVVTRDVPSGSVVAGNPARIIKSTDAYRAQCLKRSLGIGNLPPRQKRAAYRRMFSGTNIVPLAVSKQATRRAS